MSDYLIELKNITKSFDDNVVLDNVNLNVYQNEFITLLGPSGCGKTTLLRIIAGFETPDSGQVLFEGKDPRTATLDLMSRAPRAEDDESWLNS